MDTSLCCTVVSGMAVYPAWQGYFPLVTHHAQIPPQKQDLPQTGGKPELRCGSLGTTSPAVPTSHLMCCSWIPVVSCFISPPLLPASLLYLMW